VQFVAISTPHPRVWLKEVMKSWRSIFQHRYTLYIQPVRQDARGLAQHGVFAPAELEEGGPDGRDWYYDGRSSWNELFALCRSCSAASLLQFHHEITPWQDGSPVQLTHTFTGDTSHYFLCIQYEDYQGSCISRLSNFLFLKFHKFFANMQTFSKFICG
jgi:hypothetical protein